ncbi:hypothetical protein GGQ87_000880 [Brevundimonas alba]|uniref:Uncharacterized protein n=1 Tax=Brevundimonas alba TaxID=74314 RepID=A0A7X5YJA7_9CAUL|nr:hypothetical protein [Brevundimonas alba]NJC40622.1 hypothetical protein [Brevundimonas alba]
MTPLQAVSRGYWTVNGGVMFMMLGVPIMTHVIVTSLGHPEWAMMAAGLAFLVSWPAAWLTWSLLVTRWRIWAYERVEDLDELKAVGVAAKLLWPEGHSMARTEIRTRAQQQRIRSLEDAWAQKRSA